MAAIGGGESTGYAQEPETSGKVLLVTTIGELDVELWSKETPLACRNFIQLCMEGYYDNCIFHRIIKDFMAQTGDPTGTGQGGDSIYGQPFKNEFHNRLRPTRRGIVGMANQDAPLTNTSQFFITLGPCDWLQKKNTIFGKVTGKTLYNILALNDFDTDPHSNRPLHQPPRIIRTEVLHNPFTDIIPRQKIAEQPKQKKSSKLDKKNLNLLSFGEEQEGEEEKEKDVKKVSKVSKSSHDLLEDDKLSKESLAIRSSTKSSRDDQDDEEQPEEAAAGSEEEDDGSNLSKVKKRLAHLADEKRKTVPKKVVDDDVVATMSKTTQSKIAAEQQQLVAEIKGISEAKKKRLAREEEVKMTSTRTTAFKTNPGLSRDAELLSPLEIRRQKFVQRSSRTKNREKDVLEKLNSFKVAIQAPKFQPNPKETDEEKREESRRMMQEKAEEEDQEAKKAKEKEAEIQRKKELYIKLRAEEKREKQERLKALADSDEEQPDKSLFPETSGGIEIAPSSLLSDEEEDDDGDEGWMTHKVRFLHRPQDIKRDMDNFEKDYSVFDPRDKNAKV